MTRPDYRNSPTLRRIAEIKQAEFERYNLTHPLQTYLMERLAEQQREPPLHQFDNPFLTDVAQPSTPSRPPSFLYRLGLALRNLLGLRG